MESSDDIGFEMDLETAVSPRKELRRPELLAPAGNRTCIKSAIENGADAVYFGLEDGFNARARAENMSLADIDEIIYELHLRGVKGYVTLNTLVFSDELDRIEPILCRLANAGVDAVLVQDLGLVHLIREVAPKLPIHASTQMTLTSAENIAALEGLGIQRVVLPRELSAKEIKKVASQTSMELETFIHGALCVAYSGQCLTSESLGGRSANRGQCAQACRLPYELYSDGKLVPLGDVKYLLSPQDLAGYAAIPELIEYGIACLKIEGRLKTPEYVANITRAYRDAIDQAMEKHEVQFTADRVREMELSFSRGFSPGWLEGCEHKRLVPGKSSAKRGVLVGRIRGCRGDKIAVELNAPLQAGDGVVFAGNRLENEEIGGKVYQITRRGKLIDGAVSSGVVDISFFRTEFDSSALYDGQEVFKTDDPRLTQELRKSFTNQFPIRKVPLDLAITAREGEPLVIEAVAANGQRTFVASETPLEKAQKHPLSEQVLQEQFSRLGKTIYELRRVELTLEGTPMVPLSVLGKLRHEMVAGLEKSPVTFREATAKVGGLSRLREAIQPALTEVRAASTSVEPRLHVLCRSLSHVDSALANNVPFIYVDFHDIREYGEATRRAHSAGAKIAIATPRIQKPGEYPIFRALAKHGADAMLVRNLAGMDFFLKQNVPVVVDFSLNATNELTTDFLKRRGVERVTPSYDLNRDQLTDMLQHVPPLWIEVVVHQHMPMFHMEHCVFCSVLSPGTNKTNCGRPCDRHTVELRDRVGVKNPLQADVGCRNTLFNGVAQSGAEVVPALINLGVRDYRLDFLNETADEISTTIELYRKLLRQEITGGEVWKSLKASNRVGVTRGTLEERRNPLAIL